MPTAHAILALPRSGQRPGARRAAQTSGTMPLTLLHSNDIHARYQPATSAFGPCEHEKFGSCYGGFARMQTAADCVRAEAGHDVLFLDAGGPALPGRLWLGGLIMRCGASAGGGNAAAQPPRHSHPARRHRMSSTSAGDVFTGSLWDTHYQGQLAPIFQNHLGVQAMTLGWVRLLGTLAPLLQRRRPLRRSRQQGCLVAHCLC